MTRTLSANFDGKVIVPDEPVQLPVGQPLRLTVTVESPDSPTIRQMGTLKGTVETIAADFDAPLDDFAKP